MRGGGEEGEAWRGGERERGGGGGGEERVGEEDKEKKKKKEAVITNSAIHQGDSMTVKWLDNDAFDMESLHRQEGRKVKSACKSTRMGTSLATCHHHYNHSDGYNTESHWGLVDTSHREQEKLCLKSSSSVLTSSLVCVLPRKESGWLAYALISKANTFKHLHIHLTYTHKCCEKHQRKRLEAMNTYSMKGGVLSLW